MAAPRMTTSVLKVLAALLAEAESERYGLQQPERILEPA